MFIHSALRCTQTVWNISDIRCFRFRGLEIYIDFKYTFAEKSEGREEKERQRGGEQRKKEIMICNILFMS